MNRATLRAIGLTAALGMGALGLAGCGQDSGGDGNASGSGKTLDVLVGANANHADQFRAWQQHIADAFKKQTGADLKFETFASANDELQKIQTSVVAGQGPDVYQIGTTFTPTAYSTGAFVKLDQAMWDKVGGRDRFVPATLGISGPAQQNQIAVPFTDRPYVLAYNTDLFKEAGIDKPATTWDGLLAQAKKLTGNGVYGFATGYADNYTPWKFAWAMANQAGNPLVDGNKARIDEPTVKNAYQAYFGWLTKDKVVNPAAVGWNDTQAAADFASGKSAMMLMTTVSSKVTFDNSAIKGKYAYAVMPTVPPGQSSAPAGGAPVSSIISGDNLVIAKYSQNQDLAAAYIKLITSDDEQVNYNKTFGDLPANAAAAKKVEQSDPSLAPVLDSASQSKSTPFTGAWGDIQLALTNVVVQSRQALSGSGVSDSALEAALEKAQKDSQASLDRAASSQ
ncbi:ABC transporter substrate-binding protein [Sinomonas terrae]|uniref:Extracellular solute-binding protein n=1 Tax=Sinomonas terrae TaxID=2908838 RepID=A0ABS9TZ89_9MICC|nr:extracellular solute-binding protein [Sinomonas terrae]MCH6469482.1 extracellular solute-binding protein [Sinomonas terrae]